MFKFLKYLPLLLSARDLSKAYQEEVQAKRPFYLSARFRGSLVTVISLAIFFGLGVEVDKDILQQILDNTATAIPLISAVYGGIIGISGVIRAKKRKGASQ